MIQSTDIAHYYFEELYEPAGVVVGRSSGTLLGQGFFYASSDCTNHSLLKWRIYIAPPPSLNHQIACLWTHNQL